MKERTQKSNTFFGGAAILAVSIAIVKIIGALYKIPLGRILGDVGFGHFNNAYAIYNLLLVPRDLGYLQTIVFILIIAVLVQLVEIILKKFMPPLYKALGVYLPLITTNCAVLGVTISVLDEGYNFAESLVCAVGAGVGFMVAMVLFSGVRKRLEDAQPPKCFEGLPITLVAASVTSLSFMGFGGVIENIFAGH